MKKILKVTSVLTLTSVSLLLLAPHTAIAKADDLIIEDNGAIILVVNTPVLGVTTDANTPGAAVPQAKKVETVVPANTESKVEIKASGKNDKKVQIKIETKSQTSAPAQAATKTPNQPAPAAAPTTTTQTINKTVDTVVLRDANKNPIINIKSDNASQVTIEQKTTTAATSLPVSVDTKTHEVSVTTSGGQKNVEVLPEQAVAGAEAKAVSNKNLPVVAKDVKLIQTGGQAAYQINEVRQGKLFGVVSLSLPTHVTISAESGKATHVWESPITVFLGPFIK